MRSNVTYYQYHRNHTLDKRWLRVSLIGVSLIVGISLFISTKKNMTDPTEIILKNTLGASVSIIPTGAVIQKLILPDKDDNLDDIVLGFETHEPYKDGSSPYFGAVVGRVANRIANATFHLDGKQYKLAANNGPNTLHGGVFGFSRQQWTLLSSQTTNDDADQYAALTYTSVDGEEVFCCVLLLHSCTHS